MATVCAARLLEMETTGIATKEIGWVDGYFDPKEDREKVLERMS